MGRCGGIGYLLELRGGLLRRVEPTCSEPRNHKGDHRSQDYAWPRSTYPAGTPIYSFRHEADPLAADLIVEEQSGWIGSIIGRAHRKVRSFMRHA